MVRSFVWNGTSLGCPSLLLISAGVGSRYSSIPNANGITYFLVCFPYSLSSCVCDEHLAEYPEIGLEGHYGAEDVVEMRPLAHSSVTVARDSLP